MCYVIVCTLLGLQVLMTSSTGGSSITGQQNTAVLGEAVFITEVMTTAAATAAGDMQVNHVWKLSDMCLT